LPYGIVLKRRVFYESNGNGLPLIFVHGSMANHHTWDSQLQLSKAHHLLLLDLPGHGQSEPLDEPITVKLLTDHVAGFAESLGIGPGVFIGHSLGGAICLQLALDSPALVQALVLIGTGAKLGVLPAILEALKTDFRASVELAIGGMAFASPARPEIIERTKRESLKCRPDIAYADFVACNSFDVRQRIPEIKAPTLIIVGDQDRLTPVKWSQFLTDKISGASLQVVASAGHMVMLEQPQEVNRVILAFLDALSNRRA
jgi:pimeloyl-ACP methyl ester carboxylesterase